MLEIDKVIVLENNEQYLVLDKVANDGIDYYYIAKVNETETDIENNYKLDYTKPEKTTITAESGKVEDIKKSLVKETIKKMCPIQLWYGK